METEIRQKMNSLNSELNEVRARMSKISNELTELTYGDAGFKKVKNDEFVKMLDSGDVFETPWGNFVLKDFNKSVVRVINIHKEHDSFEIRLYSSMNLDEEVWCKKVPSEIKDVIKFLYSIKNLDI